MQRGAREGWSGGAGRALVVGVVGARGGVGASTLAALVAARGSRRCATVLVDLDEAAGGLDVLVGLEEVDGARWPDLAQARGDVDGRDLVGLLPRWGRVAVLSADRERPGLIEPPVRDDVLRALAAVAGLVVLDLGRAAALAGLAAAACDRVALLASRDLRSVAGALALRGALVGGGADVGGGALVGGGAEVGLVVRGPAPGGLGADELATAVSLPVLWAGRADAGMARAAEHGVLTGRGPAGAAAAAVLR